MQRLSSNLFQEGFSLSPSVAPPVGMEFPERVLQFGEGNFLRAFCDWMIDRMNRQHLFCGRVVAVQPIEKGLAELLNEQDGLYTVILRGYDRGALKESREMNASISRAINPYTNWPAVQACAQNPEIRFVISNTTEAGIVYAEEPYDPTVCPTTFPAKVTSLLHLRFRTFHGDPQRGWVMIPCELIDRNGDRLKEAVTRYAEAWNLEKGFFRWIEDTCIFLNTLVDRIVPGYPRDEAGKLMVELGYEDKLLDTGEYFHFWAIEGPSHLAESLPLTQAGLNVVWTDNLEPYRTRKVRVLNGAHTSSVLAAFLGGIRTVKAMMDDVDFGAFVRHAVFEEILPVLSMAEGEKTAYAEAVLERFRNPYIQHELLSIALNSVSKWKVRVLPSLKEYRALYGCLPPALTFSLAALLRFYKVVAMVGKEGQGSIDGIPYPIRDDEAVLAFFAKTWRDIAERDPSSLAVAALSNISLWDEDLTAIPGLVEAVTGYLVRLLRGEVRSTVKTILSGGRG